MLKIFSFALFAILLLQANAQDCQVPSCGAATHIDCEMPDGAWGASCPATKNMLNLAPVISQIVDRHNDYRNKIAGGQVTGFDPAKRMGLMVWNVTLANLCRKNVRQCMMKHDECHNTPEYDFTGQNLGYRKYLKTSTDTNIGVMLELTDKWYNDEITKATKADFYPYKGDLEIANVAQILRDYATRVGCAAAVTEPDATYKILYYCCNYDMGNIQNWPTYYPGTTASKCKTGTDGTFKNLCSGSEVYDVNTFWKDVPYMTS